MFVGGEQAAFHGKPSAAVVVLEQAVALARSQGRIAEMAAAGWLLGVALAAGGRYGGALTVLAPMVEVGRGPGTAAESRLFAALAASTIASVHRQLGRHAVARASDLEALVLSEGTGEAGFDAYLGLGLDAIGLGEAAEADSRLEQARALVPSRADQWWRQRVRLGWADAEACLLDGEVDLAVTTAREAIDRAEQARAPRHVAKGLLILGLAQVSGGQSLYGEDDVVVTLRRAATLAESLGALPLVWPARALLGALLMEDSPAESDRCLSAARSAVLNLASDLPPGVRAEWLARPDVAALLEG